MNFPFDIPTKWYHGSPQILTVIRPFSHYGPRSAAAVAVCAKIERDQVQGSPKIYEVSLVLSSSQLLEIEDPGGVNLLGLSHLIDESSRFADYEPEIQEMRDQVTRSEGYDRHARSNALEGPLSAFLLKHGVACFAYNNVVEGGGVSICLVAPEAAMLASTQLSASELEAGMKIARKLPTRVR